MSNQGYYQGAQHIWLPTNRAMNMPPPTKILPTPADTTLLNSFQLKGLLPPATNQLSAHKSVIKEPMPRLTREQKGKWIPKEPKFQSMPQQQEVPTFHAPAKDLLFPMISKQSIKERAALLQVKLFGHLSLCTLPQPLSK